MLLRLMKIILPVCYFKKSVYLQQVEVYRGVKGIAANTIVYLIL